MLVMTGFVHVQNALWEQDLVQLKSQVQQVGLPPSFFLPSLACHAIMKNLRMMLIQYSILFNSNHKSC